MNTIGKILVILNFLFAVVVGLLIVLNAATRNKLEQKFKEVERDAKMIVDGHKANSTAIGKVAGDNVQFQKMLDNVKQALADKETELKVVKDLADQKAQEYEDRLKNQNITLEATKQAKERLTKEIDFLNGVIKERENSIVALEASVKTFRIIAQNQEANFKTAQIRNENLLEQLRAISGKLARYEAGVTSTDTAVIRNPNAPNPPSVLVNGKIEIVSGNDLVQINQGSDHGLEKDHTLDVYRLTPEAKYLGMVRIIDANTHASVGRLVASGNVALRAQLKVGDLVTSKLTSR